MTSNRANVNINLQTTDNYFVIIKGNPKFKSKDITFQIKNFIIPSFSILESPIDNNENVIYFPAQGRLDYDFLKMELMLDDNFNSYLELLKWLHRLKNPEVLLQSHLGGYSPISHNRYDYSLKQTINSSIQHPIEYRDIDVYTTDRNNIKNYKFNFVDSWIKNISQLGLDAQKSDYIKFDITLRFLYMRVFDMNNNQIIPPLDNIENDYVDD